MSLPAAPHRHVAKQYADELMSYNEMDSFFYIVVLYGIIEKNKRRGGMT